MKLCFMKQDAVDFMKHNMERLYTHYFQNETNEWMAEEYGSDPFVEFLEIPDFELADIEAMSIGEADFENCKILYNNLRNLSESQCSDERLWAGLCNNTFYDYLRRRYQYNTRQLKRKETDSSAIISRFYFSGGTRSGFFRNGLAKCWWVGRATFDKEKENHFEKLDIIGSNDLTTKISDIFYSNTFASNPKILAGICDGFKFFTDRGLILVPKTHIRAAMKYLNAVGGAVLLDVLTQDEIANIIISRIGMLINGQLEEIDLRLEDEEDQLIEINEDDDSFDKADENVLIHEEQSKKTSLEYTDIEEKSENDQSVVIFDKPNNTGFSDESQNNELLPAPDFITYGCWVRVLVEKANKEKMYHIPLKNDKSREMFQIERLMMGQSVGYRTYMSGDYYRVVAFGWD